jgi:hypothetical protein
MATEQEIEDFKENYLDVAQAADTTPVVFPIYDDAEWAKKGGRTPRHPKGGLKGNPRFVIRCLSGCLPRQPSLTVRGVLDAPGA